MQKWIFIAGMIVLIGIMALLSGQTAGARLGDATEEASAPATASAIATGTEQAGGAACEALRALVTPAATATEPAMEGTAVGTAAALPEIMRPSVAGGPGEAVTLFGNFREGGKIFANSCQKCHGPEGQGGVANPGSTAGIIPVLNPINPTLIDADSRVYTCNLDLFVEHGSVPQGAHPKDVMPAFGDKQTLSPQQIADVIAYVISLNGGAPVTPASATAAPTDVQ